MAKDARDTDTADFIGIPVKRGRKPTGSAATAAERQRAYRLRKAVQGDAPSDLMELLQQATAKCASLEKEKALLLKKLKMAKR